MKRNYPSAKSTLRVEIKALTETGSFEGRLSPYGNVDDGYDVVEPGAYTKTLKEQGTTRPLLWQHKTDQPIGQITLDDRADGLWCKGQLLMDLSKAKDAYLLLKAGIVKALSIGFESKKDDIKDGVRHLREIKLYEGSLVTFPMNQMALITNVKQTDNEAEPPNFNDELSEVQLWDMPNQISRAFSNAFYELLWSRLTADEMTSAFATICEQLAAAGAALLPDYAEAMIERYGGMEAWSRRILEVKAKGKTSRGDGEDLTAGDFLIVGDPEDTSTWKLPWKFSTDDKTKSHLRNALARFDQLTGVSETDLAKAKKKLISLCEKYGITVSDDFKKAHTPAELKVGMRHSADTKDCIKSACEMIKGGHDMLKALIDEEAGASTSSEKAASPKPEPAEDHSAAQNCLTELQKLRKS